MAPNRDLVSALATIISLVLMSTSLLVPAYGDGGWRKGRATRYGGPDDFWNIHEGSCHYSFLDPNKATGWDIVALSDQCDDYSNSCGRCYEVKCDPSTFTDNYGESFDRSHICYDPEASLVVQVTDSCPCDYPNNAYSNKRWCCGDMYHFDMSTWAFEKLADNKWGVMGILVRPVSCSTQPYKRAQLPSGASPTPPNLRLGPVPDGWQDKRPWS